MSAPFIVLTAGISGGLLGVIIAVCLEFRKISRYTRRGQ